MTILPRPELDYTQRDFESLHFRLQGLIRSVFPDWTDFSQLSFGNILLELFAYVGDNLAYYQDAQAAEAFWATVTQRAAAIRLGRLINFELTGATTSTGTVTFTVVGGPTAQSIPIPVGTRLRTRDPNNIKRFQTTAAGTIGAGQSSANVAVEQSVAVTGEAFASTGGASQELIATRTPFVEGSLTVTATDGDYVEVDSFLDDDPVSGEVIGPSSLVYTALVDQFDRVHIRFGDGTLGKIPQGTITLEYKTGGGVAGNVEAGSIAVLEDQLYNSSGSPVSVTVANAAATSGGTDRMTVAEARRRAPQSLRTQTRCVTRDDFEVAARQVAGVSRAVMITSNEDASVTENAGRLLVVARGTKLASGRISPATPSQTLLDSVLTQVTSTLPATLTFTVITAAPTFRTINVSTRIYLERGADAATVKAAINTALADFFASELEDGSQNPDIDFGANILDDTGAVIGEIAWSDIFNAIRDVTGVRRVDEGASGLLLNSYRLSVTLTAREFPILGTVTVVDASTGVAL